MSYFLISSKLEGEDRRVIYWSPEDAEDEGNNDNNSDDDIKDHINLQWGYSKITLLGDAATGLYQHLLLSLWFQFCSLVSFKNSFLWALWVPTANSKILPALL